MKCVFGSLQDYDKENNSFKCHPDSFIFDTDWFINTNPSIKDTDKFLPEWEDASDIEWVLLYFLAEKAQEVLSNNKDTLCDEAKIALENYINSTGISSRNRESSVDLRKNMLNKFRSSEF